MEKKFIYVFSTEDRDALLKSGFTLIKTDETQTIFVFENANTQNYNFSNIEYLLSDTLTF